MHSNNFFATEHSSRKIEVNFKCTTHSKILHKKSLLDYLFNIQPFEQIDSTKTLTNSCSSSDDFERFIKLISSYLTHCNKESTISFLITAKGKLDGININISWNNLDGFRKFLQEKNLIDNKLSQHAPD